MARFCRSRARSSTTLRMVAVAVVALAVSGVVAYASADKGAGGYISLEWISASAVGSAGLVHCLTWFSSAAVALDADNLAPGTNCALTATLKNVGNQPAYLDDGVYLHTPRGCPYFGYTDNLDGLATDPMVSPWGTFTYHSTFSLGASAGNSCEWKTAILLVMITG